MISGGSGAWRSRRQARGDAEPGEPHSSVGAVHQNIGRLDVLVDEAALVRLAQRGGDADREAQEASHLHGRAEQPLERLAARILEHQHRPTAFALKRQRPRRPAAVQLVLQFVFVGEAIEGRPVRVLRGGQHGQHGDRPPSPSRAILGRRRGRRPPTRPGDRHPISVEPKGWVQLPGLRRAAAVTLCTHCSATLPLTRPEASLGAARRKDRQLHDKLKRSEAVRLTSERREHQ